MPPKSLHQSTLGIFNTIIGMTLDLTHPNPKATTEEGNERKKAADIFGCGHLHGAGPLLTLVYHTDTQTLAVSRSACTALDPYTSLSPLPKTQTLQETSVSTTQRNVNKLLSDQNLHKKERPLVAQEKVTTAMRLDFHRTKTTVHLARTSGQIPVPKTESIRHIKDKGHHLPHQYFNNITGEFAALASKPHMYFTDCYQDPAQLNQRLKKLLTTISKQLAEINNRYSLVRDKDRVASSYASAYDTLFSAASRCIVLSHIASQLHASNLLKIINKSLQAGDSNPILLLNLLSRTQIPVLFDKIRAMTLSELLPGDLRTCFRDVTWKIQETNTPAACDQESAAAGSGASAAACGGASAAAAAAAAAGPGLFLQPASPREQLDGELLSECIKLLKTLGEAAEKPTGEDGQGKSYRDRANAAIAKRSNTALKAVIEMIENQLKADESPTPSY